MPYKSEPQTTFVPPPEGVSTAVLVGVTELGMQPGWKDGPEKPSVYLTYELPDQQRNDGVPVLVGKQMTISFHEKANLAKHVAALHGSPPTPDEQRDFQVQSLLGKACSLIIQHGTSARGNRFAKIQSVAPYAGDAPEPVTPLAYYNFDAPDPAVLSGLPPWVQGLVEQGKPWDTVACEKPATDFVSPKRDAFDDDVPF